MLAVTLRQPFPLFIARGLCDVIVRDFPPPGHYTGPLLIHAGRSYDEAWRRHIPDVVHGIAGAALREAGYLYPLPRSSIVAYAVLSYSSTQSASHWHTQGSHRDAHWGWYLGDVVALDPIIPDVRGQPGLWAPGRCVEAAVRKQLADRDGTA